MTDLKVTFNPGTNYNVILNNAGENLHSQISSVMTTLTADLVTVPTYTTVVENTGGRLQTHSPITLKNVLGDTITATVDNLTDIGDVVGVNVIDNSTLVYNSTTQRYEVNQMPIDGGLF